MANEYELTPEIKKWLETPASERNIAYGAELLVRVNRNQILYGTIMRNPAGKAKLLEYHLQRVYDSRVKTKTVHGGATPAAELMKQAAKVVEERGLDKQDPSNSKSEFQAGRRGDHDELPEEVQALYIENRELIQHMRDAHTRLRLVGDDAEREQVCKQLLAFDKRYRENWNKYDHYVKGTALSETPIEVSKKTIQRNAVKTINLALGRYAKKADPKLAEQIRDLYKTINSPSEALVEKMRSAGLI